VDKIATHSGVSTLVEALDRERERSARTS